MLSRAMRWLALDLGTRRVGAALCDAQERVVTPLAAFPFERLMNEVQAIVREYSVEGIVVGVPTTGRGQGRGEVRARNVIARLAVLGLPVENEDERGTTAAAESLLRQAGVPPRRWAGRVDSLSAQLILESFLARRRRDVRLGPTAP